MKVIFVLRQLYGAHLLDKTVTSGANERNFSTIYS